MRRPGVLVVGAGERVRDAVLPVLAKLDGKLELQGVFSRTRRSIEAPDGAREVEPLEALTRERLEAARVLYLVVAKHAVPAMLARLAAPRPGHLDLVLETPGLLYKHLPHARKLRAFRRVSVAEDCAELPFLEPLRAAWAAGEIGELESAELDRSAYAYHGIAMLKALLGNLHVARARRRRLPGGGARREVVFAGGVRGAIVEPRDYGAGRIALRGTRASVADVGAGELRLEALVEDGRCVGFRCGEHRARLAPAERELMGAPREGSGGVTRWMDGMKRVGLLRSLARVAGGGPAYPLEEALDDMAVDYHLEKLGLYVANPLTSARGLVVRGLARAR